MERPERLHHSLPQRQLPEEQVRAAMAMDSRLHPVWTPGMEDPLEAEVACLLRQAHKPAAIRRVQERTGEDFYTESWQG